MMAHPVIPNVVLAYVRNVFAKVNNRVTITLSNQPNIPEPTLDNMLVMAIQEFGGAPKLVNHNGKWVITLRADFLAGIPLHERHEVGDIGIMIEFRRNNERLLVKSALLQSKKLYSIDNGLQNGSRIFSFEPTSRYAEIKSDEQIKAISAFSKKRKIPVFYSLYNPWRLPLRATIPLVKQARFRGKSTVGTRIIPSSLVTNFVAKNNISPTYSDLLALFRSQSRKSLLGFNARASGWRLENWISDLVLGCKSGYLGNPDDEDIQYMTRVELRGRPIAVALWIGIDMPQQYDTNLAFTDRPQ
jgi:hypothetical protein